MLKKIFNWFTNHPDVKVVVIIMMIVYAVLAYQYVPYHIGTIYAPFAVYFCGSQYWNTRRYGHKEAFFIIGMLVLDIAIWISLSK